jgi:MSHA biogenesis protein MshK
MAKSLKKLIGAASLLWLSLPAVAIEFLQDPTRPAVDLSVAKGGAASESEQPVAKDVLQSVIISPQYRAAVISGVTVKLGGKVGEAKLIEVRDTCVVLEDAKGKRVIELYPGVRFVKVKEPASAEVKPVPAQSTGKKLDKKIGHKRKKSEPKNTPQQEDEGKNK